jgi:hypothetical protein
MGMLRVIDGKSASGSDADAPDGEAAAPSPTTDQAEELPELGSDADDQTLVVPSGRLVAGEILPAPAVPERREPVVKVPMPSPPVRRSRPRQAARDVDEDADTFFDDEREIEHVLERFVEPDADDLYAPIQPMGMPVPMAPLRLDGEVAGQGPPPGYEQNPGFDSGPPPPTYPHPPRARTAYPLLPLAPPLPPPMPLSMQVADPTGAYQAIGYSPVTGSYQTYTGSFPYIVQPVMAAPPGGSRWAFVLTIALVGTTAVGVGLGWLLFARDRNDVQPGMIGGQPAQAMRPVEASLMPAPASSLSAAPPAASTEPAPAPGAPAASATTATPATPVSVDIASLEHPPMAPLTSPLRGEVSVATLRSARPVSKGERLFEVKRKRTAEGQAELASRIEELKRLAQEDPVYEAFLARAQDEYKRSERTEIVQIKAPASGVAEPVAGRGDKVELGQTLASMTNTEMWSARATVRGAPITRDWTCAIASADSSYRAICRIEQVATSQSGDSQIAASVEVRQVPWLRGVDQRPRLILEPPRTP